MIKVGVYVDVENIRRCGGYGMQYDILRQFACREGGLPMRLNAYVGYDRHRGHRDKRYERTSRNFFYTIRDYGFKVIEKEVKWFRDDDGNSYAKANADLDMAVDALLQSENLDRVVLVTGDGDFVQVVRALQNRGCRVEVIAFDNVSVDLRREVDLFISGYMIPNLLSTGDKEYAWGEIGSRVRGVCYYYKQEERFGFIRYLAKVGPTWITDSREVDSPYQTAYCNDAQFVSFTEFNTLPSRTSVFEFTLAESDKFEGRFQARDIILTSQF